MDESESFEPEMTELQESSYEVSEADEDEVEELQNSLREVVQDHSVKPKLQCLMVDPSFSMVTVQSEDSGIVWETASSRCSTPWASETSSVSEGSMEGSGSAGKITIIFDEEKVVRRRVRRLSDRFSRPGSSRSASALGVERLEMMEVSQPNVKQDKTETEPDLEELKSKDQQLFSLISEGYEILNIRVPSKLPTVDEEQSTELQDNLSYLDQTPRIKSRNHLLTPADEGLQDAEPQNEEIKESSSHPSTESSLKPGLTESPGDIDYFEKFTLLDIVSPDEQAAEEQDEIVTPVQTPEPEQTTPINTRKNISTSASEESFVFVSDVDIVGEHLDEVFYGEGPPTDLVPKDDEETNGGRMRRQSSIKESGSVLFDSEETVLTPIYISSGPPKIIDPILLEEPTAMSFMYSDLYEDAVGERTRSDEECSEAESVTSEKSYKRCLTDDCEEADGGYLEKFILKDETPTIEISPEVKEHHKGGRMMWIQNEFEMSGCLIRVTQEEDTHKAEKEVEVQEVLPEFESGQVSQENNNEMQILDTHEEIKEKVIEDIPDGSQEHKSEFTDIAEVLHEAEIAEIPSQKPTIDQSAAELDLPTDKVVITDEVIDVCRDTPVPATEILEIVSQSGEETQSSESVVDAVIVDTEPEIPKEAARDEPLEVSTNCEPPVHAHVEVIEKGETELLTQICIDLKEEIVKMDTTTTNESTLKAQDLGQEAEIEIQDEAKTDLVEKPAEMVEPKHEVSETANDANVAKEMVSVGDELIVLVPKGQAVEMDIEVSLPPEKNLEPKEDQLEPLAEAVMQPKSEEKNVSQVGENAKVITKEDVSLPVETTQEVAQSEMVSLEPSNTPETEITPEVEEICIRKEAKSFKMEEIPAVEINNLEKQEFVSIEPSSMPITDTETTIEEEEQSICITKEDVSLKMEDSQAVEVKHLEKTDIVSVEPSSVPITDTETTLQEEEEQSICITKEDVSLKMEKSQAIGEKNLEKQEIVLIEPSSIPISDTETTIEEDQPVSIIKKDLSLKMEEIQAVEVKNLDKQETVSIEPSSIQVTDIETTVEEEKQPINITKEELSLKMEEIQAVEVKNLEKEEIVLVEPRCITVTDKTSLEEEEKNKVIIKEDIQPCEDEHYVEESHTTEQETDLGESISMPPEKMVVPVPETLIQIQTTPQPEEKDKEAKYTEDLMECHEVEVIDEMEPEIEIVSAVDEKIELVPDKAGTVTASEKIQDVALDEQVIPSDIPDDTVQEISISSEEVEMEKVDYEIVIKHEAKELHKVEFESKEQMQESITHTEVVDRNLDEEAFEIKDEDVEELQGDLEEDTCVRSTLKRFTPLEDLSGLHTEDMNLETTDLEQNDLGQDDDMDITEDVQDVAMPDVPASEKKESPDVIMEEYEIITEQQVQVEMAVEKVSIVKEDELKPEEDDLEETTDVEHMEVDYDTIDAEEERQSRLAAELEGLDWYCVTCGALLSEQESQSEPHQSHQITTVDRAYDEIMEKVGDWISELQERSENIEDLVSELELAYNSVEDQFHDSEAAMQVQNEEMMALVMDQYNSMSINMEEEKKAKLEQLYDQIVSFQESIDSAKGTLETTAREADTDARSPEDIHVRLTAALDSAMSLELGPKSLLVFEDYAKGNTSSSQLAQRKGIPVPQRPTLQAQEPGSATSSSVTVYWKVNPDDVIDCFQVYCMEDPQGAVSEEYRVTVKESYCVLEELEPDKTYKVWVMAVNYTGCSLPSERLIFKTAPSVPVIDSERCTVAWDTAVLRWSAVQQTLGLSYTLEYCRQYELEGEGLRTISGIMTFEQKVLLQPNENYLFYIKAVNEAGASEQSEAALISTKGTRFHLLKATAHPALELSVDQTTLHYSQESHENITDSVCPFILGEQLPVRGHFYWEVDVSRSTDYRLGVASTSATPDCPLGENHLSWCLQCTATSLGGTYHLVHNGVRFSFFVIDVPDRVGIFLDLQFGRLCFYNAQSGQLLGSFCERFTQSCHPAVGMDAPGSVEVCMVQEPPEFVKDS